MLTVCCFRWRPPYAYRTTFGPETVNVLASMVSRHYAPPHRFCCFTDDAHGIDATRVEVFTLWADHANLPSPVGLRRPSCYRRLKMFDPAMGAIVGDRWVWLDLDCVVVGDLAPLWDRPEPIVLWGGTHQTTPYNGSMVLASTGARPQVWTQFQPHLSPRLARAAGHYGSDQAWLSYVLGPHEARWTQADGVLSFRCDVEKAGALPSTARIVMFHGPRNPWDRDVQEACPWVREHYR